MAKIRAMPALAALLTVLCIHLATSVTIPPKMIKQSPIDIFYKKGETVKMECVASGEPTPSYFWKRAEVSFSPEGNDERIVIQKDVGTLIINSPEDKDEGIYQCFATNSQGTAATKKYNLKMAKLDEFSTTSPIRHNPQLGRSLTLNCQSPNSVPDADIYWVFGDGGNMQPVFWDNRITMDYEDRLYFTYVSSEDYQGGKPYHCVAYNSIMRMNVIGPPQYITPQGTNLITSEMKKLWPTSRFDEQGLVGSEFKMKCIFSGNPTPNVRWKRKDGMPFNSRVLQGNSGGQELVIKDLRFEDAGTYLCDGTREQESTPLEMSINLNINSPPIWKMMPEDVSIGENGTAQFECLAEGVPKPQVFWYIDGVSLESALKNDRRLDYRFQHLKEDLIVLQRVTKLDTMVFQCNITNIHGYLWGEAFLNVLSEAPTITELPRDSKVAEGQPFEMTCKVTGKPDPIITWYRNGQHVTGGRYLISESGSLYVEAAVLSDAGEFRCHARNAFGSEQSFANLIVRRKTVIQWMPMDLEVQRGVNAKFTCSGTTDPEETTQMTTTWLKDGDPVDLGTRMFLNTQDLSLTISGSEQRDTGTYTCVVSNGLDNDTSSARLVVTDIPDASYDLEIKEECLKGGKAELEWIAGSFNNAPIEYFIIEYMTKIDPNRWVFAAQVDYRKDTALIPLAAGMDYSFRVTSYNKIGASSPSVPSNTSCVTTSSTPTQNPRNVRTIGDKAGMLHIEWTPVPPEHQGGKNFTYVITIQREGDPDSSVYTKKILDWRISEFIYPSSGVPYTRYKLTVKSRNADGDSAEPAPIVYGYSSEGAPLVFPTDLSVTDIQSDNALFMWNFDRSQIGKINSRIQGQFEGFKIQTWEQGHQADTIREYDVDPDDALANSTYNLFSARVPHLLPNTHLQARVALLNNFFVSRPSDTISFVTAPGLPGPVELFEESTIGDNHVNLQWRSPLDNRGDIIGFDIGYQQVHGLHMEEMQERSPQIDDPYATTAMLSGLLPNTKYRIHIWARTVAGRGEVYFIERTTIRPGVPRIPRFTIANVGTDFINITWWRDAYQLSGSVVYVEYKIEDSAEWFSTSPDVSKDWVKLNFLQAGIRYNIRISVTNGETTRLSQIEDVTTDGTAKAYAVVANLGWFLGMIFSLLLEIAMVIVFVICYRRGFRFKSDKQEIRTYRNGSDTYTDKEEIPRVSKDFEPEPEGFSNDYYKNGYNEEYDDEVDDGFDRYEDNGRRFDNDYYTNRTDSNYRNERDAGGRSGSDYEEYNANEAKDTSYNKSDHSDIGSQGRAYSNYSSDIEGRGPHPDETNRVSRRKEPKNERIHSSARSKDYTDSSDTSHRRQTTQRRGHDDYPVASHRDDHFSRQDPRQEDRRNRRDRQDSPYSDAHSSQASRYSDEHYQSQADPYRDDHQRHSGLDHDHDKCDDVVDEFKHASTIRADQGNSRNNADNGHSSTVV